MNPFLKNMLRGAASVSIAPTSSYEKSYSDFMHDIAEYDRDTAAGMLQVQRIFRARMLGMFSLLAIYAGFFAGAFMLRDSRQYIPVSLVLLPGAIHFAIVLWRGQLDRHRQ